MNKILGLSAVLALLAACDQRPTGEEPVDTGGGGTTVDIGDEEPIEIVTEGGNISVGNLESASLDEGDLVVQVLLDGTDTRQVYSPDGDAGPNDQYSAYEQQESSINRSFAGIFGENGDGSLSAVVVMDGGQFNRFFGGGNINQSGFSAPASGFYYYTGDYAGLLNFGGPSAGAAGTPGSVAAQEANPVEGQAYLLADFVDNNVEGVVFDRTATIGGTAVDLADIVLVNTAIIDEGQFTGAAEANDPDTGAPVGVGAYTGAFDEDATFVAAIVALNGDFMAGAREAGTPTEFAYEPSGFEAEYGLFVIGQCPGGADSCFPSP